MYVLCRRSPIYLSQGMILSHLWCAHILHCLALHLRSCDAVVSKAPQPRWHAHDPYLRLSLGWRVTQAVPYVRLLEKPGCLHCARLYACVFHAVFMRAGHAHLIQSVANCQNTFLALFSGTRSHRGVSPWHLVHTFQKHARIFLIQRCP